jgi:hypothetical protein
VYENAELNARAECNTTHVGVLEKVIKKVTKKRLKLPTKKASVLVMISSTCPRPQRRVRLKLSSGPTCREMYNKRVRQAEETKTSSIFQKKTCLKISDSAVATKEKEDMLEERKINAIFKDRALCREREPKRRCLYTR